MIYSILGSIVANLPMFIVYVVGAVLALKYRRNYPRATTFLLLAIALSFVTQILSIAVYNFAPYFLLRDRNFSNVTYGYIMYSINIIFNLFYTAAFGLLLAAIFSERVSSVRQT